MGRPPKREPRDHQINIRLTPREYTWVSMRALALGMRPVEFGRNQLFATRPVQEERQAPTQGALDPHVVMHLSRIGNNLNQIARRLNQLQLPLPEPLEPLLAAIRDILRRATSHGA